MLAAILLPIPLALFPLFHTTETTRGCWLEVLTPQALEERAVQGFSSRLDAYVELHRRLARSLEAGPILDEDGEGTTPEELRAALIAARPLAAEGDFFTPAVAVVFRDRVIHALLRGVATTPGPLFRPPAGEIVPKVNEAFPFVGMNNEWPALFLELPELPYELRYALWGHHLVLVDVAANLVVDVLPDVLPEGAYPGVLYP